MILPPLALVHRERFPEDFPDRPGGVLILRVPQEDRELARIARATDAEIERRERLQLLLISHKRGGLGGRALPKAL